MSVQRFSKSGILGYNSRYTSAWSPSAIGGTITTAGGYRIHTFTTVGADTFQALANLSSVEYLLVAGGGGGGGSGGEGGGGGGAGGYRTAAHSVAKAPLTRLLLEAVEPQQLTEVIQYLTP